MERPGRRALGAGLASVEMILILTTAKCWLRIMKDFDTETEELGWIFEFGRILTRRGMN